MVFVPCLCMRMLVALRFPPSLHSFPMQPNCCVTMHSLKGLVGIQEVMGILEVCVVTLWLTSSNNNKQ